jgi:beta-lactamase regulating signal transducer with metallopeptidase domain
MDILFDIGLRNAALATLLAVIAWVVGKAARRPALTHVLWILVLLRLVIPPVWNISVPRPAFDRSMIVAESATESTATPMAVEPQDVSAADIAMAVAAPQMTSIRELPDTDSTHSDAPMTTGETAPPQADAVVNATVEPSTSDNASARDSSRLALGAWPWKSLVAGIWLFGSMVVFGIGLVRLIRFSVALHQATLAPVELVQEVGALAQKMGLTRQPDVLLMPGRFSPLLWGVFVKPRLVLPEHLWQKLDAGQRAALLVHELAHYARGDHWVRVLEWLAAAAFWWHPVLWLARANLREAEEQCCDAWVIWMLPERRRDYATAIVDTLDFLAERRPVLPALASGVGTVRNLRRRLTMILREDTPRRLSRLALLGLLGIGAAMLALGTTWADDPPRGGGKGPPDRKDPPLTDRRPDPDDRDKLQAELQRARKEAEEARANLERAMRQLQDLERRLGERNERGERGERNERGGGSGDPRGAGPMRQPGGGDNAPQPRFAPGGGFPGGPGQPPAGVPGGFPGGPGQPPAGMMPGRGMPGMGGMPGMPGMPAGANPQNLEQRLANLERAVQDMSQVLQEIQRGMQRNTGGGRGGPNAPPGQRAPDGGRGGERLGTPPGPGGAPTPPPPGREPPGME